MTRILAIALLLAQASTTKTLPATDIKAADIQAAVKEEIAKNLTDMPIRTVDAGGQDVSIAVVGNDDCSHMKNLGTANRALEDDQLKLCRLLRPVPPLWSVAYSAAEPPADMASKFSSRRETFLLPPRH